MSDAPLVAEIIERASTVYMTEQQRSSRQPRYNTGTGIQTILNINHRAALAEPPYGMDVNKRDAWLLQLVRNEPFLSGVVNNVLQIDKSRGWAITGAEAQVERYSDRLRNVQGGAGWRDFVEANARAYYNTDTGFVVEVEREGGQDGAMLDLWTVDPTIVTRTGDATYPLLYNPTKGKRQNWRKEWYIQSASMRSIEEAANGLGFCAVSRSVDLVKLMVGMFAHHLSKMQVAPPRGFVLTSADEDEFQSAVAFANAQNRAQGIDGFYAGVAMLFGQDAEAFIRMISLSELPDNFELNTFVALCMKGISLCFGYSFGEFYAIDSGSFGRAGEEEVQAEQSRSKGELDFVLAFFEKIQSQLPDTIKIEPDERNEQGDLLAAEVRSMNVETAVAIYEAGAAAGKPSLPYAQFIELLIRDEAVPAEWADLLTETPAETTDVRQWRDIARGNMRMRRAARWFASEPLVRYEYPADRLTVLFDRADDILRPRVWSGARMAQRPYLPPINQYPVITEPQPLFAARATLYEDDDLVITDEDVTGWIANTTTVDPDIPELLNATLWEGE